MTPKQIKIIILLSIVCLLVGVFSVFRPQIQFNKTTILPTNATSSASFSSPTPTFPPVQTFQNITNTYGFAYPASWSAKPVQIGSNQNSQLFAVCGNVSLAINEYLNTLQTPAEFLDLKAEEISKSTIDGHTALIGSDQNKAVALIQDTSNKQLIELIYAPACGQSIQDGKNEEFYPLLHSFTFASDE